MTIDIKLVKQLRDETKASIADCRKALDESNGNYDNAIKWLQKHGVEKAGKKADRETSQGLIESYIHQNSRVGALVEILCETDFVARTNEFKNLAHEVAMQITSMDPKDVDSLLEQAYIRESNKTIEQLVKETISKLGENIVIKRFSRFQI